MKSKAYYQGYNAVWEWPEEAPRNPYDADTQPDQYGEWENQHAKPGSTTSTLMVYGRMYGRRER